MSAGHAFLNRGCCEVDEENCIASGCFCQISKDDSLTILGRYRVNLISDGGKVCHNLIIRAIHLIEVSFLSHDGRPWLPTDSAHLKGNYVQLRISRRSDAQRQS